MTTRGYTNATPPPAPKGTSAAQARIWKETVESFPDDWFRGSDMPLLTEMVRALDMSNRLAKKIARCKDDSKLKSLLEMRDRECRRAAALSTKMRLPPQSRSDRHVAGVSAKAGSLNKPWDQDASEKFFDNKRTTQ